MNKNIGKLILNLIYPPRCIFCGKRLSPKTKLFVCDHCSNNLPYCKVYKRCKVCGNPIPDEHEFCRRCYLTRSYVTASTSPFVYVDNVRNAIIAMKRPENIGNARVLSFYIAGMVKSDFSQVAFDAVVSVPPRRKRRKDNYDQAGELGKEVAKRLSLPYISNALSQTREIKKQSSLNFDARIKNVKDAFKVKKPDKVKGKIILLIDDIRTTGATLNECGKALKEAGAYRVYSATSGTTVI